MRISVAAVLGMLVVAGAATAQVKSIDTIRAEGLTFGTGATSPTTERMRVTQAGNVGIGLITPTATLQVNGSFTVSTSAQNTTPSLYVGTNGNIGIGTVTPSYALELSGYGKNIRIDNTGGGYSRIALRAGANEYYLQTEASAFNGIGLHKALPTTASWQMVMLTNGNMGIGTTTPASSLTIVGEAQVSSSGAACVTASNAGAIRYSAGNLQYCNSSNTWATLGTSTAAGSAGDIQYNNGTGFAGDTGQLFWDATNNHLGIGSNLPKAAAHIAGGLAIGAHSSSISETLGNENSIQINTDTYFGGTYNDHSGYLIYSVMPSSWGTARLNFARSTNWGVYDTSEPVMSLGSNVGIGTISPAYRLDVSGSIRAGTGTGNKGVIVLSEGSGGNTGYVSYHNTAGTRVGYTGFGLIGAGLSHATDNATPLIFITSASERVRIDSSGNVGIGTSSPAVKLHVYGASPGGAMFEDTTSSGVSVVLKTSARQWNVSNDSSGNFQVYDANAAATRFLINSSGNVGIGTVNPNAKLEVNGTISATTIIAAPPMMILADEKATTTAGGACTAGTWVTRTLNTERGNTISGASLSSNQFTLPAGTYHIDAESNGYATNRFQIRIYNVTDAAVSSYGMSVYSAGSSAATISRLKTIITIAAAKTFRLEGRCNTSSNSNDWGVATNFGGTEVYSLLEITKLQ